MSIFEKIAQRELPGHIVWEDDTHIAFLSIAPLNAGHTLVIPKKNLGAHIFDLAEADYLALMQASYKVAQLLQKAFDHDRILTWVEGFEVPHVHVHLLPVQEGFDIRTAPAGSPSQDELAAVCRQIVSKKI